MRGSYNFLFSLFCLTSVTLISPAQAQQKGKKNNSSKKDTVNNKIDSLKAKQISLDEVVITAKESKGLSTASIIDRKAMQHLQPSSFTDLLALLPGGRSADPNLRSANLIHLRQTGTPSTGYDISSLGTSFLIDGAPISTRANMQYTAGLTAQSDRNTNRDITAKGVDMRTLSTDQIERVEIIRGIPSVEYGDITNGVVKIIRKQGESGVEARFKSDGFSKLAYVGKGFAFPDQKILLNVDFDYLDAKADPTNRYENFKRVNTSIRLNKLWENNTRDIDLKSSLDYGTSFDNYRSDPDLDLLSVDKYKSTYNRLAFSNNLNINFHQLGFLKSIVVNSSLSMQRDQINQTKWVQTGAATTVNPYTDAGVHDIGFLPPNYTANLLVDGKPVDAFLKAMANMGFKSGKINHAILVGAEANYSKNLGLGQVFDPYLPPSAGMSTRPRSYRDIPATKDLSVFAEDRINVMLGAHKLEMVAGARAMTMAGLSAVDPRANAHWTLPGINIGTQQLQIELGAGIGWQSKFPVIAQLYPDYTYYDLEQLNYYHNNPEYRKANVMTYKFLAENRNLQPARNRKWELKADFSMNRNRLSITYFKESMTNAFRNGSELKIMDFKKYDASGLDPDKITAAPDIKDLPYQDWRRMQLVSVVLNNSALYKEGIEYRFASNRVKKINTRITIYGAWFKTVYENHQPVYRIEDRVIDNKQFMYAGLYADDGGYIRSQLNTNAIIDTYLPKVGLEFSTAIESSWFSSKQNTRSTGTPISYVGLDGISHPYTEADKSDKYLQWLNTDISESQFAKTTIPIDVNVNFKVVKNFKDKIRVGMFVNRIFNYAPDYTVNGYTIKRSGLNSPYFGMELNFNL
ncbi:TonB-dependent receptor plug domain-containing protein [Pedobacter sp. N36a]|uniref:TonB-dependent receptor plug domain-containing protein n=1 Tax=Pedobacter sp. N36a TaxID=2767996 RepID=UPI00165707F0|nr:TonB-dependent receptor [Pedobacter sp. N36a]MBC8986158.1 TonB-dependent receptor plug domain-containing protein [Pedobacter sp. N36a]